jgi:hypothetical protein
MQGFRFSPFLTIFVNYINMVEHFSRKIGHSFRQLEKAEGIGHPFFAQMPLRRTSSA